MSPGTGADRIAVGARPGNSIRGSLLDDHEAVRRGVHDLLNDEPDITVVGEAGTAEQVLIRVPVLRPQVTVLARRVGRTSLNRPPCGPSRIPCPASRLGA